MTTIYGASDDLIEVEGDVRGELNVYDQETILKCSDGTLLAIRYGKPGQGAIWDIDVLREGSLFSSKEICVEETEEGYSDKVILKDGVTLVEHVTAWKKVK